MNKKILFIAGGVIFFMILGVLILGLVLKQDNQSTDVTDQTQSTGLPTGSLGTDRTPGDNTDTSDGNLGTADGEGDQANSNIDKPILAPRTNVTDDDAGYLRGNTNTPATTSNTSSNTTSNQSTNVNRVGQNVPSSGNATSSSSSSSSSFDSLYNKYLSTKDNTYSYNSGSSDETGGVSTNTPYTPVQPLTVTGTTNTNSSGNSASTGTNPLTNFYRSTDTTAILKASGIDPATITDSASRCALGLDKDTSCMTKVVNNTVQSELNKYLQSLQATVNDPSVSAETRAYAQMLTCTFSGADLKDEAKFQAKALQCAETYQATLATQNQQKADAVAASYGTSPTVNAATDAQISNCVLNILKNVKNPTGTELDSALNTCGTQYTSPTYTPVPVQCTNYNSAVLSKAHIDSMAPLTARAGDTFSVYGSNFSVMLIPRTTTYSLSHQVIFVNKSTCTEYTLIGTPTSNSGGTSFSFVLSKVSGGGDNIMPAADYELRIKDNSGQVSNAVVFSLVPR